MVPGLNGLEILEVLDKKPVVIVISGMKNIKDKTLEEHPCIVDFIAKPINVEDFKKAVNSALKLINS